MAGVLHVVLGPDHLSAIMTMSVFGRSSSFWQGIRWGVGHSIGIGVVAVLVFAIGETLSKRAHASFDYWGSIVSGVFMIFLGLHFMRKLHNMKKSLGFVELDESERNQFSPLKQQVIGKAVKSDKPGNSSQQVIAVGENNATQDIFDRLAPLSDNSTRPSSSKEEPVLKSSDTAPSKSSDSLPPLLSVIAGVVGGAAGPGGVLAIVPASYYPTFGESLLYVFIFMAVSTGMMGLVALGYGELTFRFADSYKDSRMLVRGIYFFSSGMSIFVGALWIALTVTGVVGGEHA